MAYIGPEPNPGHNREVDDISSSFNGSTTAFTLQVNSQNVSPGSANAIIVSLGGVIQNPNTDYTVASSTLTFTTAPASGLAFFGLVLGQQVDTETTADGSVTTAKLADDAVTYAKLANPLAADNEKIRFGTGSDLEVFHDATHSRIHNNTGLLLLECDGTGIEINSGASTENMAKFLKDGACELYYDNVKTIETETNGIRVTGHAGANVTALSDGATITVNLREGTHFSVTLGGNRTFGDPGFTSAAIGSSGSIFIVQDGTGSRTAAFHGDYKFAGGTAPTLSTAAGAVDRLDYIVRASDNVHCVVTLDVK